MIRETSVETIYKLLLDNCLRCLLQVPGLDQHYICVTPDQGIVFPSVTYMRNLISKAAVKQGSSKMAVVINCTHVSHTDFTAAESFHAMIEDFKSRGQVSCDWWRAGHVTSILTSDWCSPSTGSPRTPT